MQVMALNAYENVEEKLDKFYSRDMPQYEDVYKKTKLGTNRF